MAVLEDEKVVRLEHIMPKTRSQHWLAAARNEEEYLGYVNGLGNLTLIERERNRAANSSSFKEKQKIAFSRSDILITKHLINYGDWTTTEIDQRQAELATTAVKIWSLPY